MMAMGLAIAIERFVFLRRARSENRVLWDQVLPMLQSGQVQGSGGHGHRQQRSSAIGKIVSNGLRACRARAAARTSTTPWKKA